MCEQARFRCNDYWLNYRVKMQFTSVIQVSHLLSNSVAVLFEYRPKAERITWWWQILVLKRNCSKSKNFENQNAKYSSIMENIRERKRKREITLSISAISCGRHHIRPFNICLHNIDRLIALNESHQFIFTNDFFCIHLFSIEREREKEMEREVT